VLKIEQKTELKIRLLDNIEAKRFLG